MSEKQLMELVGEHYSSEGYDQIKSAVDFAKVAHRGQKRISGEPYINHPLAVAAILIDWQMDISSITAGVLHDTIEDSDTNLEEIEKIFGHEVAFIVDGVTKVGHARSGMGDISKYLPQTKDNLSKLLIAVSHDLRVLIIKLADRLHNIQTLHYLPPERQQKVASETLGVFAPMADRLGMGKLRVQFEDLSFKILEPKEYSRLEKMLKKKLGRSHKNLELIRRQVAQELIKHQLPNEIDGRIKGIYSLHKKLKKVDGNIDQIYDLMAIRVIVDSKEECYRVLGIIHSLYQPVIAKIKDYIAVPKPNGYRSLHTTVITPSEQIVEFQIRTKEMHWHADRGLAAGFHYNEQKLTKNYVKGIASQLPQNMDWISRLQSVAERAMAGEEVYEGELSVDLFSDRIFVYSPKGDIYDLPEGSFPLDFAFAVHSDIAMRAIAVKINGKIAPFSKQLQNGDIVQIETRRSGKPHSDWLDYVKTSRARGKLKAALKKS